MRKSEVVPCEALRDPLWVDHSAPTPWWARGFCSQTGRSGRPWWVRGFCSQIGRSGLLSNRSQVVGPSWNWVVASVQTQSSAGSCVVLHGSACPTCTFLALRVPHIPSRPFVSYVVLATSWAWAALDSVGCVCAAHREQDLVISL